MRTTEDAHNFARNIHNRLQAQRDALLLGAKSNQFTNDEKIRLITWAQFRREAREELKA